ncbi:hypothetical protein [Cryptosporangium phraense]|uniref:LuxR family transcriptional regulator n=1 Tax=Cryptosporangium phraense TaxID=2593070 RepID=A0A545AQA6_9ACTN|nr:hypothetical protein [Cryptosporangium phraense]TQS43463.1 hypothetical protein FL583_19755 [Cryptosporangium phraense]
MDELARRRVPPILAEQLGHGFGSASEAARQVAGVAALLGRRWRPDEVAALLGWPEPAVRSAAAELTAADLVAPESDSVDVDADVESYAFRHESFQRYAVRFVPAAARRGHRRAWVDLRLAAGASPVEVASVLAVVAEPGDAEAVAILAAAARALGENTPAPAADLYLRALDLDPPGTPEHARLAAEAAVALWAAERGEDGSAVSDASLRGFPDAPTEARARLELALRVANYSSAETIRQCRLALALPGLGAELRARLLSLLIGALYTADEYEDVPELQEPARAAAGQTDDVQAQLTTLESGSVVAFYAGDWEAALAAQDEADALRTLTRTAAPRPAPYDLWPCMQLSAVGRAGEGLALTARETRRASASGLALLRWGAARAQLQFNLGRLALALAEAEGVREFDEVVDPDGFAGVLVARVHARTAAHRGMPEEVAAARRAVAPRLRSELRWQRGTALLDAALLADQAGDTDALAALIGEATGNREPEGVRFFAGSDAADELLVGRLALRAGHDAVAREVLDTLVRLETRNPRLPFLHGLALHLSGLVDRDAGRLLQAAAAYATSDRVLVRAGAFEDAGRQQLADGRDADTALRQALRLYSAAGCRNDADRIRARLAAAGRPVAPGDEPPLPEDPTVRAAELAAGGLGTPEIAEALDLPAPTVRALLRRAAARARQRPGH